MSEFIIRFNPQLGEGTEYVRVPLDISPTIEMYDTSHLLDIQYEIGTHTFGYYPAAPIVILNDLISELQLVKSRSSHDMTLSGYKILEMDVVGTNVILYDPVATVQNGYRKAIERPLDVTKVEQAFEKAIGAVWRLFDELGWR